jgi:hypothetical protein
MGREDMNDLDRAIETITEGGEALGVSCEDVYRAMARDEKAMVLTLEAIHQDCANLQYAFTAGFELMAKSLIKEAQRANLELEAGG